MRYRDFGLLLAIGVSACAPSAADVEDSSNPLAPARVILFIGDGAGLGHWTVANLAPGELAVERFPVVGLIDTRGTSSRVTDSAAGATAYATGVRTFNGAIGVGPDSLPATTVLEAAEQRGLATGLVTNSSVTDASPAAFAAHVPDRGQQAEIASQMASHELEVLLGGGRGFFDGSLRSDSRDLLTELRSRYTYVETPDELTAEPAEGTERLLGLFADQVMFEADAPMPSLPEMAAAALAVVDQDPDGFFLMIESEATDGWAHGNEDLDRITEAMLELDETIGLALEYRAGHPETLIVVVADHETGGLAVETDSTGARALDYTTGGHTWALVPLFAIGPGAERFAGILANARVGENLFEAIGAPPTTAQAGSSTADPR